MLPSTQPVLCPLVLCKRSRTTRPATMCISLALHKSDSTCSTGALTKKFGELAVHASPLHFLCVALFPSKLLDERCDGQRAVRFPQRAQSTHRGFKGTDALHCLLTAPYQCQLMSQGILKIWDVRQEGDQPELVHATEQSSQPISYLHTSPNFRQKLSAGECGQSRAAEPNPVLARRTGSGAEGQFLAVNGYDNVIRVYDRYAVRLHHTRSQPQYVRAGGRC